MSEEMKEQNEAKELSGVAQKIQEEAALLLDDSERDNMMKDNISLVFAFCKKHPFGSMSYQAQLKEFREFCKEWDAKKAIA